MRPSDRTRGQGFRTRNAIRGDVSILLVFLILAVLITGAMALAVLAVSNLRGVGNIVASSQAFYAVDTGIERGLHDYYWDTDPAPGPTCTKPPVDQPVAGSDTRELRYELTVDGRKDVDSNGTQDVVECVTVEEVVAGTAALCVEAIGKARDGLVRRRVTSDNFVPPHPGCNR